MLSGAFFQRMTKWFSSFGDESYSDRRSNVLMLQWLVVIGTSYLSLFSGGTLNDDPGVFALIVVLMLSGLVLQRLPERAFQSASFGLLLVFVDVVLILLGIGLKRESPWDLFLLFFLCLYIAGVGESLLKAVLGCLLFSIAFTFISLSGEKDLWLDSEMLVRIPFLFGVSVLYAYLAHQVKAEKKRADEAEHAEAVRRRLVSGLAHDIKSPLSVVKGFSEVISINLASLPGHQENLNALQRMRENIDRVLRLVMGFLDASKAESGEDQRMETPVAVNWLIQEVARDESLELFNNCITLDLNLDANLPEVLGEVPQLERVLWNLLSNAIKFTPRNGKITVSSELVDGEVCVKIADTGVGIAPDDLPLLFAEYGRLKGSGEAEGTGLGLYIVKNIVKSHRGSVSVESELGKGATFTLRFPAAPSQATTAVSQNVEFAPERDL